MLRVSSFLCVYTRNSAQLPLVNSRGGGRRMILLPPPVISTRHLLQVALGTKTPRTHSIQPLSPYFLFCASRRNKVLATLRRRGGGGGPIKGGSDVGAELARQWKAMSVSAKKPYAMAATHCSRAKEKNALTEKQNKLPPFSKKATGKRTRKGAMLRTKKGTLKHRLRHHITQKEKLARASRLAELENIRSTKRNQEAATKGVIKTLKLKPTTGIEYAATTPRHLRGFGVFCRALIKTTVVAGDKTTERPTAGGDSVPLGVNEESASRLEQLWDELSATDKAKYAAHAVEEPKRRDSGNHKHVLSTTCQEVAKTPEQLRFFEAHYVKECQSVARNLPDLSQEEATLEVLERLQYDWETQTGGPRPFSNRQGGEEN